MGEVDNNNRIVLQSVFNSYDEFGDGELSAEQLQRLHADLRTGGVSLQQVQAAIKYVCLEDTVCDLSELNDALQELDRRYFLLQDLRWEFSMLDSIQSNAIHKDQAKWLVQAVHGKYFSNREWEKFLRRRLVPATGINFAEIEVLLCNVPNRYDVEIELLEVKQEQDDRLRRQKEIDKLVRKEKESELRNREQAKRIEQKVDGKDIEVVQPLEEQSTLEPVRDAVEEEDLYHNVEQLAKEEAEKEMEADKDMKNAIRRKEKVKDARRKKEAEADEKSAAERKTIHKRKRIRYDLKVAIKSRDKFQLQHSIKEFTDEKLDDHEMDLEKAQKLLKELTSRDDLRRAMSQREIAELEQAMQLVKKHGLEANLAKEMISANKILSHLRRLERIRHEILELKQSTVAEIRSYQSPPAAVHTVMTCTFLLLDHPEKETKNWKTVQALVGKTGKESLKRRCLGCDPGLLKPAATDRAKTLLNKYELDEVRDVSAGAATFYVWAITMIEEAEAVGKQKEEEMLLTKQEKATGVSQMASSDPRSLGDKTITQRKSKLGGSTASANGRSKSNTREPIQEKMNKVARARRESR